MGQGEQRLSATAFRGRNRKRTTKNEAKTRILKSGAAVILEKGFLDAGLAEILEKAKVPKGSFYFYFRSKEDFGLQVIDYFAERLSESADRFYREVGLTPLERIRGLYRKQAEAFQKNGFLGGCPIGNLALEMGDRHPEFRNKLEKVIRDLKEKLKEQLDLAREKGEIDPDTDTAEAADFIFNSWEGALLRMKVGRSLAPYEVFDRMVFGRLLKSSVQRKRGKR